jgi:hypothetical protein
VAVAFVLGALALPALATRAEDGENAARFPWNPLEGALEGDWAAYVGTETVPGAAPHEVLLVLRVASVEAEKTVLVREVADVPTRADGAATGRAELAAHEAPEIGALLGLKGTVHDARFEDGSWTVSGRAFAGTKATFVTETDATTGHYDVWLSKTAGRFGLVAFEALTVGQDGSSFGITFELAGFQSKLGGRFGRDPDEILAEERARTLRVAEPIFKDARPGDWAVLRVTHTTEDAAETSWLVFTASFVTNDLVALEVRRREAGEEVSCRTAFLPRGYAPTVRDLLGGPAPASRIHDFAEKEDSLAVQGRSVAAHLLAFEEEEKDGARSRWKVFASADVKGSCLAAFQVIAASDGASGRPLRWADEGVALGWGSKEGVLAGKDLAALEKEEPGGVRSLIPDGPSAAETLLPLDVLESAAKGDWCVYGVETREGDNVHGPVVVKWTVTRAEGDEVEVTSEVPGEAPSRRTYSRSGKPSLGSLVTVYGKKMTGLTITDDPITREGHAFPAQLLRFTEHMGFGARTIRRLWISKEVKVLGIAGERIDGDPDAPTSVSSAKQSVLLGFGTAGKTLWGHTAEEAKRELERPR